MPDAFDILGLPPRFDLDPGEVQRAYLARAAALHPDRARGTGGGDDSAAAAINAAKGVLDDPEQRANLLLTRAGGPGKDQDRSLPEGFLQLMIDAREAIDAAVAGGQRDQIDHWVRWATEARAGHMARVGALLTQGAGPEARRDARRELNAWRYIERMLEQIEA